jgi:hypothetical protein
MRILSFALLVALLSACATSAGVGGTAGKDQIETESGSSSLTSSLTTHRVDRHGMPRGPLYEPSN